ncbi:MAG: glycosyltransferase family 1 protein [bacterium]|nr:glycosyltransferase family 1 protein [bacterium]
MKKILVDGFALSENNLVGVSNYTWQIIKHIANTGSKFNLDVAFLPPFNKEIEQDIKDLQTQGKLKLSPISDKFLWTQVGLASKTFLKFPSVLFSTRHTLPIISNPFTKKVLTVHDVGFEKYHSKENVEMNKKSLKRALKVADKIIAVSEYTKSRLVEVLKINPDKIVVIHEGVDFKKYNDAKNDSKKIEEVKSKYNLKNYILHVGTIQPRKNLKTQFAAFAKFNLEASQLEDIDFVVAGSNGWDFEDILAKPESLNINDNVKFVGRVSDEDLPYLTAGAKLLSFVSLEEGFGLPVLNAFAAGVPVVTSNNSALKEIGQDVAVLVSPGNVDQISDAYRTVYFNEILQLDLCDKGIKKAMLFGWDKAAEKTIQLLESL